MIGKSKNDEVLFIYFNFRKAPSFNNLKILKINKGKTFHHGWKSQPWEKWLVFSLKINKK